MSMIAATSISEGPKRYLNLGCGKLFNPEWINIDFHDHGGAVLAYDLRLGIPFADDSFDLVYHSHLLEHFPKNTGKYFLTECYRVLRPGGILRIVVPDLENIARAYLSSLEQAKSGEKEALERHEWMTIELLDQMVRLKPGGEMGALWRKEIVPAEDFIIERTGQEYLTYRENQVHTGKNDYEPPAALPPVDMDFMQSGELHRWMYDLISLTTLLRSMGFTAITRQNHDSSLCAAFPQYNLDNAPDGSIRKPDSLFVEALKPEADLPSKPRVVVLSTSDFGGAGIAAKRQHLGRRGLGINSTMYVAQQYSRAPALHVIPLPGQQIVEQGRKGVVALSGLQEHRNKQRHMLSRYPQRPPGCEYFSTEARYAQLQRTPLFKDFDVIDLHWVADFIDVPCSYELFKDRPIVWTLHDMRPFTGGCHYAGDCGKYMENCGACPQLGSEDAQDISFQAWRNAMSAYRGLDLHIVSPSAWLAEKAGQSSLLKRFPTQVIHHALPLDTFKPMPKAAVRESLGIARDSLVLTFAGHDLTNERKGGKLLLKCLAQAAAGALARKIHILLVGLNPVREYFTLGLKVDSVGLQDQPEGLALIYNASDALILPSLEENSPNVICEAISCGIPAIAFAAGGIPEMVKHEETGWLAPVGDVDALTRGLYWLDQARQDPALRLKCRSFALETWNPALNAAKYESLFEKIIRRGKRRS